MKHAVPVSLTLQDAFPAEQLRAFKDCRVNVDPLLLFEEEAPDDRNFAIAAGALLEMYAWSETPEHERHTYEEIHAHLQSFVDTARATPASGKVTIGQLLDALNFKFDETAMMLLDPALQDDLLAWKVPTEPPPGLHRPQSACSSHILKEVRREFSPATAFPFASRQEPASSKGDAARSERTSGNTSKTEGAAQALRRSG